MRYLVTGGFGFMGSWVTDLLVRLGHDVFILSRRAAPPGFGGVIKTGNRGSLAAIQGDIVSTPPRELAALLPEKLDGCVHAASFNEASDPSYAKKALDVNGYGTRNLLEALVLRAQADKVKLPFVVCCSTFHVYGRTDGYIVESTPTAPTNDYALTHLMAEEYCRMFERSWGLPQAVIRCTNGYASPKVVPFGKWYLLFHDLCRGALKSGRVVLHSDPATVRDFIWMGDVAAVIASLLERPQFSGSIFNVASGKSVPIGQVAALVAKTASEYTGREIPLVLEHNTASVDPFADADMPLEINNDAMCMVTGVVPKNHMEAEIHATLKFLSRHGDV